MKTLRLLVCISAVTLAVFPLHASEPDLGQTSDPDVWRLHNRAASPVPDRAGAVRLDARADDGVLWVVGSDFNEGTIEVDLRGANKPGQSFVGIAFRGTDDSTYDALYFRPFNFQNPEVPRRRRAVQYVSMPEYPWPRLRQEFPGKYEAAVAPVPDPDGWFHARLVIAGGTLRVFVNDATDPCLIVEELSARRGGGIGLWVGNGSGGDFANLAITPR